MGGVVGKRRLEEDAGGDQDECGDQDEFGPDFIDEGEYVQVNRSTLPGFEWACESAPPRRMIRMKREDYDKRMEDARIKAERVKSAKANTKEEAIRKGFVKEGEDVIYVQRLSGERITLPYHPQQLFAEVKTAIKEQTGIDEERMRLIFCGFQMHDDRTLSDYNCQRDSTLHLVLRLRGGPPGNTIKKARD
mmetsp:Transcript_2482/g.3316  ORF Transcript_2482/g.3316 Transcript_2482/m.3316 type:complete len:191 (-) Transcript_2482:130-702(-)|eukprot:CAMPEP_0201479562 /NCGR_PEP_ID=MMETSP0151_2-20130828/4258_1 /ASSEMBLY_ACC=CAM_ASM_000257 /TAXON_ID=200890 /ORGANISM="Paramoeba atlantica, Strain 621/1 / CCAP 1560/9" /LENGTH=190 /DNA_ID=CAMNT_0047861125 /DNA_START=16 /DNA_END=588 /DNA_ORIENTATION=+